MELSNIIKLIKKKDAKAEKELFLHFAPKVLTICRRYASQNVEAQDYMQECFILIFAKIHTYDSTKGSFEGWLHRVCTNRIIALFRKSNSQITMTFPETLPEPSEPLEKIALLPKETVLAAIQELPDGYRKIFNLYIFEGWSHREIGEALSIAETTSRSQLTRAKKLLQQLLLKKNKIQRYGRQFV